MRTRTLAPLALALCALTPSLMAQGPAPAPARFVLRQGSSFTTGCQPPCTCPITYREVQGSLLMTKVEPSPLAYDVYTISDVAFLIGTGTQPSVALGTGIYYRSQQFALTHRMELDLSIDGAAPVHYETDWVLDNQGFPSFQIALAKNGFYCLDEVWDLSLAPELMTNFCTSLANSSGGAAHITATGSNSVTANDLALHAGPLPAGQPGLFYFGSREVHAPFGDGFRCVSGLGTTRLPIVVAGANGVLSYAVDNTNLPNGMSFLPGTTWAFQAWFRDPAAGSSGFNLSDAGSVVFDL